jgi:cytochrome P450
MDTTAHTLSFVIYALAVHNDIQHRAQLEVDTFIASGKKITDGMLPPYVEALLKESMRKYPTAATGSFREVQEEEGYQLTESIHLPRGYWIAINFYCLHNSKLNWGEDAEEFKPERWLDSLSDSNGNNTNNVTSKSTENNDIADPLLFANDNNKKIKLSSPAVYGGTGVDSADDLCYAPFSFGTRNCVGMNLALIEMRLSLFAILSKFSFDLANPDMKIERNALETSFTMRPAHGMPVYVRKR